MDTAEILEILKTIFKKQSCLSKLTPVWPVSSLKGPHVVIPLIRFIDSHCIEEDPPPPSQLLNFLVRKRLGFLIPTFAQFLIYALFKV